MDLQREGDFKLTDEEIATLAQDSGLLRRAYEIHITQKKLRKKEPESNALAQEKQVLQTKLNGLIQAVDDEERIFLEAIEAREMASSDPEAINADFATLVASTSTANDPEGFDGESLASVSTFMNAVTAEISAFEKYGEAQRELASNESPLVSDIETLNQKLKHLPPESLELLGKPFLQLVRERLFTGED